MLRNASERLHEITTTVDSRTECVVSGLGNMHRILWFDEQVRYGKYPNSGHLSQQFEISVRQACRDIEYLMNTLRAPLVYNPKKRGYQYEDKAYALPALMLTASDIRMLQAIIAHLEQTAAVFGVTSFSDKAVELLRHIISHSSYDEEQAGT